MTTYLSPDVQAGLDDARKRAVRQSRRLRVHAGEDAYPVLRAWEGGFAMEAGKAGHLRGLVDLYDGTKHLSHCLIVASEEEGGEIRFELKRVTPASDEAPVDFERDPQAPVALIGRD
ncbi:hypothetical protein [uncultured Roseovarius sp.]|uniref:hypothetical protein n=1 Tax=uncultured Roseovarius sp. TaxID=293344 RepID=UPI002599C393|nr:hypothetical protein [uncultured Roseovarius sp.]